MSDNPSKGIATVDVSSSIESFNGPLGGFLSSIDLPVSNVLANVDERRQVIESLERALSKLPIEKKQQSHYLTKFTVSVAVGLFDGALNYLWDETIKSLRKKVSSFDLTYFFSVLEQVSKHSRGFETEEDLSYVSDHDLLEASRRIGLLSDVNFKKLELINYMRNHASAAHPNDVTISGAELLAWLGNCLDSVISATPDSSAIKLKQLLKNLRDHEIPNSDFSIIQGEINKMPPQQIDDLMGAMFGIYCDPRMTVEHVRTNIEGLILGVWSASSEDKKFQVGTKYGEYRKTGDVPRKERLERILGLVDGHPYKDEDSIAYELGLALGTLRQAHYSWNNFYNESPHAQALIQRMPASGTIPSGVLSSFVKVVSICHAGNGKGHRNGVDENADMIYQRLIKDFKDREIREFLKLFRDPEFTVGIAHTLPAQRVKAMADRLHGQATDIHVKKTLDVIRTHPGNVTSIEIDSRFKTAFANAFPGT